MEDTMSMDELLLQELYGSQQVQAEQQIKQAQIELVEAVAAEAGVDLNELDDAELAKFAHYVLSDEDEPAGGVGNAYAEQTKLAEADLVGRQMAHSYADEMSRIQNGETMRYNTMSKVASAMSDVADAWHMQKVAETPDGGAPSGDTPKVEKADEEKFLARLKRYGKSAGEFTGILDKGESGWKRGGRLAGTAGALGALGYGGYRLATRNKDDMSAAEKVSMLKIASEGGDAPKEKKFMDKLRGYGRNVGDFTGITTHSKGPEGGWKRGGRLAGTAGALGALGYGGYRLATRNKDHEAEKISMYLDAGYEAAAYAVAHSPEEFAKEAEFRAAEILLANGVDPATLEQVYPENVKIASFPTPDDAISYREAAILEEYNDMLNAAAMHIIENLD
jgi:hypothetical protein